MVRYIGRRVGVSLLILLVGSFLMFVLTINSGDPLEDLRESSDPNRDTLIAQRIRLMGLDIPWYSRYLLWLVGASKCLIGQCDLGMASTGQEVNSLVYTAAGSTLRLVTIATLVALVLGIALGIITAVRQYSGFDYGVTFMSFVFYSLPIFWAAVLLKHYASIQFNDWIVDARFSWTTIIVFSLVGAFIMQAIVAGSWKRRGYTAGVFFVVSVAALKYFDMVVWFRRPAIGIPVFILGAIGIGALIIWLGAGWKNRRVVYSVATTVAIGSISYPLLRGRLMSEPTWTLLFICFLVSILVGVIAGYALGGFSRKAAMGASATVGLIMSLIAFTDLMLSNWASYLAIQSRPMATIGDSTPNLKVNFWQNLIDLSTHLLLPTIALMIISFAGYTRYTRASMLDVLNQDYIRTARSKGLSERKVITRHAFRNSLIPIATIVAFTFAGLIGGAVITETVFGWSGMGKLFIDGLRRVDPAPVMAFYLVTGSAAVFMNMMADIAYAALDPRITR